MRWKAERTVVYELRVAPEDMGKVIGKKGRVIHSSEGSCPSSSGKRR